MISLQYLTQRKSSIVLYKPFSIQSIQIENITEIYYHYHAVVGFVSFWEFKSPFGSIEVDANAFGIKKLLYKVEQELDGFSVNKFYKLFDEGDVEDSLLVWKKFDFPPSIKDIYISEQITCSIEIDKMTKEYPELEEYLVGLGHKKALIVEDLTIEGNLSLDWYEDYSSVVGGKEYGLLIVRGDLEVKGDILNVGYGGLQLLVQGTTRVKNILAMETIMIFNHLVVENLTIGAFEHGLLKATSLETRLLVNLHHAIEIKNQEKVQYQLLQEDCEIEAKLAKCFLKSNLLHPLVYEGTLELALKNMATEKFFSCDLRTVVDDIVECLKVEK